jgi:dihydropteroate synthase
MSIKSKKIPATRYSCNGKMLTFNKPLVMAIVNLTPDSFYDGGKYDAETDILRDVEEKISQGASIIDLGAASSRPHAPEITMEEEWSRLSAALISVRKKFPDIFISVDTFRSEIAERAAGNGADIINDISGGNLDPKMAETAIALDLPYVMMHMDGDPRTMTSNPPYGDAVNEVKDTLLARAESMRARGFDKIILDPGFGFGKSLQNNFELLKGLPSLAEAGFPVLAGISRKSMINKVIGTNPVTALNGTTVLNTIALLNGASILRVHDVKEAMQAIELVEFYRNS